MRLKFSALLAATALSFASMTAHCAEPTPTPAPNPAPTPAPESAKEKAPEIPALSISKAAEAAEAELAKLDPSHSHFIRSIYYLSGGKSGQPRYSVKIEPPLPATQDEPENVRTSLVVYMDGSVKTVSLEITPRHVVKRVKE